MKGQDWTHLASGRRAGSEGKKMTAWLSLILSAVLQHVVGELGQLGRCRLHGEGVFLGVEVLERRGITYEDVGKFASETGGCRHRLGLDALADLELEAASAGGLCVGDVDRDRLRRAGAASVAGRRGRRRHDEAWPGVRGGCRAACRMLVRSSSGERRRRDFSRGNAS